MAQDHDLFLHGEDGGEVAGGEQGAPGVMVGPELDPAPAPLSAGVDDQGRAAGRLAVDGLRRGAEAAGQVGGVARKRRPVGAADDGDLVVNKQRSSSLLSL